MRRIDFVKVIVALSLGGGISAVALAADNWPDYRGPTADGHSDATGLPLRWSETEHVKWKTALPGRGWSSPVVWGDQIWMTTANESGTERFALCVDKQSGTIVHNIKVLDVEKPEHLNELNSYASPTPVIEADRVYVYFGTQGMTCIDTATGKIVWQRCDLKHDQQMGPGSSPVIFNDLLIFHCDGMDVQYAIALDKATGKTVWKTDRTVDFGKLAPDKKKAFCTPVITTVNGHLEMVSLGAQAIYGYDPRNGKELWRVNYHGYSNGARPVIAGDLAIFSSGYDVADLYAVKLGGSGDVTAKNIAWKYSKGVPYKPSPIVLDGLLYMVNDSGIVICLDPKSGAEIWRQRIGGQYSASPIYAEGRIYFFSHDGKVTVIAPGRKFSELASFQMEEGFMASPAVTGKAIILRTKAALYRIEQ